MDHPFGNCSVSECCYIRIGVMHLLFSNVFDKENSSVLYAFMLKDLLLGIPYRSKLTSEAL